MGVFFCSEIISFLMYSVFEKAGVLDGYSGAISMNIENIIGDIFTHFQES